MDKELCCFSVLQHHKEDWLHFCEAIVVAMLDYGCLPEEGIIECALGRTFHKAESLDDISLLQLRQELQNAPLKNRRGAKATRPAPLCWVQRHINAFYSSRRMKGLMYSIED